jgi:hypothetical protein
VKTLNVFLLGLVLFLSGALVSKHVLPTAQAQEVQALQAIPMSWGPLREVDGFLLIFEDDKGTIRIYNWQENVFVTTIRRK